jgi:UDP-N-acetylglucosamine:LPS N-acetylglucosamine transferase
MDNHQEFNADFMVETVGGAIKQKERALTPEKLVQKITEVFKEGQLPAMKQKIKEYKLKKTARDMCLMILEML